jgi:hypothetical protein
VRMCAERSTSGRGFSLSTSCFLLNIIPPLRLVRTVLQSMARDINLGPKAILSGSEKIK